MRGARAPAPMVPTGPPPIRTRQRSLRPSFASLSPSLLFRLVLRVVGFTLPRAAQDIAHRVVSFVAGLLVEMILLNRPAVLAGPRLLPRLRILDREAVFERVGVGAGEALGDLQVLGRA